MRSQTSASEWQPPEKPDPQRILREAVDDREQGRFAQALAKHLWFHEHALEYRPSLCGVRLSFALSYWFELANEFAPARESLVLLRDDAEVQIIAGASDSDARFSEFAYINEHFQEYARTSNLFESLAIDAPLFAARVYDRAQRALIARERFDLCSQFLTSPESTYQSAWEHLRHCLDRNKGRDIQRELNNSSRRLFSYEVGDLIAILARSQRHVEAQRIAALAKSEWKNRTHFALIDRALKGEFPERLF